MDEKKRIGEINERIAKLSGTISAKVKSVFEDTEPYAPAAVNTGQQTAKRIRNITEVIINIKNQECYTDILDYIPTEKGYDHEFFEFALYTFCAVKIQLEYAALLLDRWPGSVKQEDITTMEKFIELAQKLLANRVLYEKSGDTEELKKELKGIEKGITQYTKKLLPGVYQLHLLSKKPHTQGEVDKVKKQRFSQLFFNLS